MAMYDREKYVRVSVDFTKDEYARLHAYATEHGQAKAFIIRAAVNGMLTEIKSVGAASNVRFSRVK